MQFLLCQNDTIQVGGKELLHRWIEQPDSWIWVDLYGEKAEVEHVFLSEQFNLDDGAIIEAQRDRHPHVRHLHAGSHRARLPRNAALLGLAAFRSHSPNFWGYRHVHEVFRMMNNISDSDRSPSGQPQYLWPLGDRPLPYSPADHPGGLAAVELCQVAVAKRLKRGSKTDTSAADSARFATGAVSRKCFKTNACT